MPKVIVLKDQGFCYGVQRAIRIAYGAALDGSLPKPIYLLGDLVHNDFVYALFKSLDIVTLFGKNRLEMLKQIDKGTVIFTAHGVSDKVRNLAIEKKLTIVDATCPYVEATFNAMRDKINEGYEIVFVGKKDHPETEAALELSDKVHRLDLANPVQIANENILLAHQTTMSRYDIDEIFTDIKKIYPSIAPLDMICRATEHRQKMLGELKSSLTQNDLIIIIGDKKSNNCTKLYELARRINDNKALFIEGINDLNFKELKQFNNIIVASGTSTPPAIINEIVAALEDDDSYSLAKIQSKLTINDYIKKVQK